MTGDFSSETMRATKQWRDIFKAKTIPQAVNLEFYAQHESFSKTKVK